MNRYLQKLDTVGLLLLVAAAIYYSVTNVWDKWTISLAVSGAVLIVIGIVANYRQIMASLGRRSTKYASNYIVSVVLVFAIVAGLNYVGQRHAKRFDLTAAGRFTLAPQTLQVLDKLNKDLDIKAFFPGGEYAPLKELLLGYRTRNHRVRYEFIDPDKQPDVAKQYDVTVYGTFSNPFTGSQMKSGTVVLIYDGRREKVEKRSEEVREEDLTNAMIKVQRSEAKKVYFVQGHGEKDPADTERGGYAAAKKGLEDQGYKVDTVNLASQGKYPADAKVLVLAGPTTEPFPQELEFLNGFVNRRRRPAADGRSSARSRTGRFPEKMGRDAGQRHRAGCQRRRPTDGRRPEHPTGAALREPQDHRPLPRDDVLPPGALHSSLPRRPCRE